jgi:hypothetical protein
MLMALFSLFGIAAILVVEGGPVLRDKLGELQPEIEETHTVVRVGSSFSHKAPSLHRDPTWTYVRTRNEQGFEFNIGIAKKNIANCEVGQTIIVIRQGTNARATPEGCSRRNSDDS